MRPLNSTVTNQVEATEPVNSFLKAPCWGGGGSQEREALIDNQWWVSKQTVITGLPGPWSASVERQTDQRGAGGRREGRSRHKHNCPLVSWEDWHSLLKTDVASHSIEGKGSRVQMLRVVVTTDPWTCLRTVDFCLSSRPQRSAIMCGGQGNDGFHCRNV